MKQERSNKASSGTELFDNIPVLTTSSRWEAGLLEKMARAGSGKARSSSLTWLSLAIACILVFNFLMFFRLENMSRAADTGREQVLQHLSDELLITDKHTN